MDVSKSSSEGYYEPIISHEVIDNKFYMKIQYPSHKIKLRFPCRDYITYTYKSVEKFINDLNKNCGYVQIYSSKFTISVREQTIEIEYRKIKVKVKNTESIRDKFSNLLSSFLSYLDDNLSDDSS